MFTSLSVHDPSASEIRSIVHEGVPVGIAFGRGVSALTVYLASPTHQHENQFMQTVSACDQILEVVNYIRSGALARMTKPGEEIVAVISDATEAPGWDGAGADVEAQRG